MSPWKRMCLCVFWSLAFSAVAWGGPSLDGNYSRALSESIKADTAYIQRVCELLDSAALSTDPLSPRSTSAPVLARALVESAEAHRAEKRLPEAYGKLAEARQALGPAVVEMVARSDLKPEFRWVVEARLKESQERMERHTELVRSGKRGAVAPVYEAIDRIKHARVLWSDGREDEAAKAAIDAMVKYEEAIHLAWSDG